MSLLHVRHLAAGYGRLPILFDVSFEVRAGEIVAISGGNGAGKSTLLACLSGLLRPVTGGSVEFDGSDITTAPPEAICPRGLSHVLERRRLAPFMSVLDNLRLSEASVRRGERAAWRTRFTELTETHPLVRSHGGRHACELSGGQQQMIAVLRGVLAAPRLLILDEPYQGLDLAVADELSAMLGGLAASGVGIVLTEHRSEIIAGLDSRQIRLERGEIAAETSAQTSGRPPQASKGLTH